jgi:UDP-2,4-diacetamido-2,4,6-trideoxy-beta-L-altropyranose hydrolase
MVIELKRVLISDENQTYLWISNPKIRAFSLTQKKIKLEAHQNWFRAKITADNCLYFIGWIGETAIGSVRFDLKGGDGLISFLVDPNYHGKGYGRILLDKGIKEVIESTKIERVKGIVMKGNTPSRNHFLNLGFVEHKYDEFCVEYVKENLRIS